MSRRAGVLLHHEFAKLARAGVTRVATLASLPLVALTTIGGFAAATHAPGTDMGQQAAALVTAPGWAGYVGLAGTSVGITGLLATGIVMAWSMGREFTDGTVVGLLALPSPPSAVALAKILVALTWTSLLACAHAVLVAAGGIVLGLPPGGALQAGATVVVTGALLGASALPVMWVATVGRGYLAGIGAALAIVVVTNVAAGFGLGAFLPWAVPVLWSAPGEEISPLLLALPAGAAVTGTMLTLRAWSRLQLGDR